MDAESERNDVPPSLEAGVAWVASLLDSELPPSPEFPERCERSVLDARQLRRLRLQVTAGNEWVPRPASAYIRALTTAARVPLEWAIERFGLPADLSPGVAFAGGWGRLAQELGLTCRQACLSYRLTFARTIGLELPPLLASGRPDMPGERPSLEDWEIVLAESLRDGEPKALVSLADAEDAILAAFESPPKDARP